MLLAGQGVDRRRGRAPRRPPPRRSAPRSRRRSAPRPRSGGARGDRARGGSRRRRPAERRSRPASPRFGALVDGLPERLGAPGAALGRRRARMALVRLHAAGRRARRGLAADPSIRGKIGLCSATFRRCRRAGPATSYAGASCATESPSQSRRRCAQSWLPCDRIRVARSIARNATHVQPRRQPEQRRAAHLPHRGAAAPHARLGRDQRAHTETRHEAGLVQARLLGRLGLAPQGSLARLQERLRPLRGPRAQLRRRRVHGARRLALGRPEVAAAAAAVRPRPDVRAARRGDASLALLGRPSGVRRQARLGLRAATTTCTAGSSTRARASTGSRRRGTARRSTTGAATSSSTRTTRATAAAGSARTGF